MIQLPFPSSSLAGHNSGRHWSGKSGTIAKHREWAKNATLAANAIAPANGDIKVIVTFYPPNRRGDRVNYPNRMKPYFDGIADALKVNDSRFVPSYHFAEPVKDSRVTVVLEAVQPSRCAEHGRRSDDAEAPEDRKFPESLTPKAQRFDSPDYSHRASEGVE